MSTPQTSAQIAARAAYRLGMLDALLHEDVRKALNPPGILVRSMKGERSYRLAELSGVGISESEFDDLGLGEDE